MNKYQKFLIGTLFDEEEQSQKINLHNMKAKDPQGNTRWKGAFTGGFEAGYKNTCGSKDGWTPSTFVSSVHKKSERQQRSIFDYMDKEDLGRENVSQNITVTPLFRNQADINLQNIGSESVGESIIKRLKKMQAHLDAPEDEQDMNKLFDLYAHKQQKQSQSYGPLLRDLQQPLSVGANISSVEDDDFIQAYQDFYRKVIRANITEETEQDIQKRRQQNRVYFDFTKPLEQQPQYLKQIQQIDDLQQPRKRKKNLINELSLKSLYTTQASFKQFTQTQQIERAPEDYDPYQRMRGMHQLKSSVSTGFKKNLTTQKRGEILKEEKLSSKFISTQNSLANKFISNQKKVNQLVNFFEQDKKNKRFNEYIEEMEGKRISSRLQTLSFEQAEREREEFEQKYQQLLKSKQNSTTSVHIKQKEESSHVSCRAHQCLPPSSKQSQTKSKIFQIDRKIEAWYPSKTLCKRFNTLLPYLSSSVRNTRD